MPTTIKPLRSMDSDQAQGILSDVAGALLPNPVADPEWLTEARNKNGSQDVRSEVLTEVRRMLKIRPEDESREAKGKLLEYVGTLISSYALEGVDKGRIKQRLGDVGDLAPELYKVYFSPDCRLSLGEKGIRLSTVEEVIHHPDDVQHLLPGRFNDALSIFVKRYTSNNALNDYVLVVETNRRGDTQDVNNAWQVYFSDVDLSVAKRPVDVLRAFVNVYGLDVTVGDAPPDRFLLHQTIPMGADFPAASNASSDKFEIEVTSKGVSAHLRQGDFQLITVENPDSHSHQGSFRFRVDRQKFIEIAIAYSIDMHRLKPDIERHSVDVSKLDLDRAGIELQALGGM